MLVNIKPWVLESGENLDSPDGFQKNWCAKKFPEENYSIRHNGGGSLTIWQAFSSSGKFKLQFVSGQQKATDYVKMLNDLSLTQEGCCLWGEEWISQQDNAAIHNASVTKKFLLEPKIKLLDHSACSPDLNPIENLWGLIVVQVYEGGWQYSAISELKNAVLDVWEKLLSVQLQKLADRMPNQIFEVIKAHGRSTKYQIKNLPSYSIVLLIGLIFMSKQNFKIKHKCKYTEKKMNWNFFIF